jgi:hypothetical protein
VHGPDYGHLPENVLRHLWRDEDAREQALAEVAERERAEALGALHLDPDPAPDPVVPGPRAAPVAPAARGRGPITSAWRRWVDKRIARAIDRESRGITDAVGDVLADETRERDKLISELRARIETLADRLDEIEGARQVPKVASPVALVG